MKNKRLNAFRRLALGGAIAVILAGFGAFKDPFFDIQKNVEIYLDVLKTIHVYYVEQVDYSALIKKSIDDMLKGLDPYTVYYPEADIEDYKFMNTGEYAGVGIKVRKIEGSFVVGSIIERTKGALGILFTGDKLLKIEGQNLNNKTEEEVDKLLKGSPGTAVRLLVSQLKDGKTTEKLVYREKIVIKNVPFYGIIDGDIGYIKHTGFMENAALEIKSAVRELESKGVKSLVLDLRGNPGGFLNEAVSIVNLFVEKGVKVVETRGKLKTWNATYLTKDEPIDTQIPLVLLVNSHSASAAEIVSGALQDLDRGVVLGRRSYGKGLVQNTLSLSYNAMMKVTISKYYIPSGRCIQALDYSHRNLDGSVGKVPDSLVSLYHTRNGRPVYDGGGVLPDILIEKTELHNFTEALDKQLVIFNFVNKYYYGHDSIKGYENFQVTPQIYKEFTAFVLASKFSYESESVKQLLEFKKTLKADRYDKMSMKQIAELESMLNNSTAQNLELYHDEISKILKEELCGLWGNDGGRTRASFSHDQDIQEAVALLRNKARYSKLLMP
ncbi:MAG: hypothetical protein RIS47_1034 [Bacteroidota bacterium]